MRRMWWVPLSLAGCAGDEDALLGSLAGSWSGAFDTDAGAFPVTAEFDWDKAKAILTGEVDVEEAPGAPQVYAVRRWSTIKDVAYLELTDVTDGTRGLDVSGSVDKTFSGETTLRYTCGADTCGWQGTFDLTPTAGDPLDTVSGRR